ncbi:hypothetical protein ASG49_09805 [Marmoricola sp. Leaf446]|uniref:hypothetical protein n=1 Tax=Marmoricola sp. Leaf446 TaxID=1736379 RepID=UPI0006FAD372|nr:hypothetical protein [Marmoricola sp. Leaf446]KQT92225.1 hypothetical protein ASG49_09805 [Marmoricola sp. Leaf446]
MHSDLERTLIGELDEVASNLVVPPLPSLEATASGRRRLRAVHLGRGDRFAPLLVAAAVVLLLVSVTLATPERDEQPRATAPSATQEPDLPTTSRAPDDVTPPAEPRLISYDGDGSGRAQVRTRADANNLAGAPDSFKEFIGGTAERLSRGAACDQGLVGVAVQSLRTDGYAVGAVNDCDGGYVAMWAMVDGGWTEIQATQDLWSCAVLAQYRVPSDIAGDTCYDDVARAQRPYQRR